MHKVIVNFHQVISKKGINKLVGFNKSSEQIEDIDIISLKFWLSVLLYDWYTFKEFTGAQVFDLNLPINIQAKWGELKFYFTQTHISKQKLELLSNNEVGFRLSNKFYLLNPSNTQMDVLIGYKEKFNNMDPILAKIEYKLIDKSKFYSPIIYTGMKN
ncbi:hypothetical protein CAP36_15735 [Chitinophagaceae bacterium IBVUCB2]|nr:hypothetical protein CAP36_15735 [Chitinophagaceae bacterium IBVUCB2]